jgi:hypothetical protein
MDLPLDRLVATTGRSAASSRSLQRLILVTLVVVVQALLVLVVVGSTLGLGHEHPEGPGPDRPPSPQPAGASVPWPVAPRSVPDGAVQAAHRDGRERDAVLL